MCKSSPIVTSCMSMHVEDWINYYVCSFNPYIIDLIIYFLSTTSGNLQKFSIQTLKLSIPVFENVSNLWNVIGVLRELGQGELQKIKISFLQFLRTIFYFKGHLWYQYHYQHIFCNFVCFKVEKCKPKLKYCLRSLQENQKKN